MQWLLTSPAGALYLQSRNIYQQQFNCALLEMCFSK